MSQLEDTRRKQAVRLMEGLSGIDPELLERSEKKPANKGNKIIYFAKRYGAVAATFVVLLGGAYLYFGVMDGAKSSDSSPQYLTANHSAGVAPETNKADNYAENDACAEQAEMSNGAYDSAEWMDISKYYAFGTSKDQRENVVTDGETADFYAEAEAICDRLQSAVKSGTANYTESASSDILYMNVTAEGKHGGEFYLRFSRTELTADTVFEEFYPVYRQGDVIEDETLTQFALLYDNGTLVEYRGTLEADDLRTIIRALQ